MTRYDLHVSNWIDCKRCDLHLTRKHVVLARGSIPAEIALLGQDPGTSEDALGLPFIGKSGKILDAIVADSIPPKITRVFTNVLGCIPKDKHGVKLEGDPPGGGVS